MTTARAIVAKIGVDISRFPTVKHFTWLGQCPDAYRWKALPLSPGDKGTLGPLEANCR